MKEEPILDSRARLRVLGREEAAALLQRPLFERPEDLEQTAQELHARHAAAVAIVDGEGRTYAATSEASGWLRGAALPPAQEQQVLAAAAHEALARGFAPIEALVLGKMAVAHQAAGAAGAAAAPAPGLPAPDTGFALAIARLPRFSIPGQPDTLPPFAPLADRALGLYAVVDSAAWVRRVLEGGVRTVQLRIKSPAPAQLREEIRASVAAARAAGAQLFINDHWRIALEEGAYGVHLGQEDLPAADLAALARAGVRLGVSTHAYWEVCRAWALRPSYIACGPVHPTQAKQMPWIPQGNDNLAYWCALLPCPVVAIAGMDAGRATEAMQCGAAGVAVISAITAAAAPEAEMARLRDAVARGRELPRRPPPAMARPTLPAR